MNVGMLGKGRLAGGVAFGLLVTILLFRTATRREVAAVPPEVGTGVVVLEQDCDCSWVDSYACSINDGGPCWMTCCGEWEGGVSDNAGEPDRELVAPEEGDANGPAGEPGLGTGEAAAFPPEAATGVVALGAAAVPPEASTGVVAPEVVVVPPEETPGVVALEVDCDCSWVDLLACSLNDHGNCWEACCGEWEREADDAAGELGSGTGEAAVVPPEAAAGVLAPEAVVVPPEAAAGVVALEIDCECSWVDSFACSLNDGGDCWETCCGEWGLLEAIHNPGEPDPGTVPGESLFCFSVVQSSGYEPDVLRRALARQAGIFACDTYALFCTEPFELAAGIEAIEFDEADVGVSEDNTAANTQLFLNVWDKIRAHGSHHDADWTVKVDPDCVFLPWKLKPKLMQHNGKHAFVRNCNAWPDSDKFPAMFGAIEVLSRSAVDAFLEGKDQCQNLPMSQWSEDLFITKCLEQLGASPIDDESVLFDGLCTQSMEQPGQRPRPESCARDGVPAFHPFKDAEGWEVCLVEAMETK